MLHFLPLNLLLQAGHDALSPYVLVNAAMGLLLHSFVLTPFYAWRSTHRAHHVRRFPSLSTEYADMHTEGYQ